MLKRGIADQLLSLVAHDTSRGNVKSLVKPVDFCKLVSAPPVTDSRSIKGHFLMILSPAIFLDRDNTLTIDLGYSNEIEKFQWMNGAPEALSAFQKAGIPVFIVTNQGGIGRGFFSVDDMHLFHQYLRKMAHLVGGVITDIAYCPHHPLAITDALKTPCRCRKPEPGLLFDLADKWQINLSQSVMVGDRDSDVEAGQRAGCHSYLFDGDDLHHLAQQIIATHFHPNGGTN